MTLTIAVVGAGFMGQLHARTVAESDAATLTAIVDVDAQQAASVAAQFGVRHYGDAAAALADDGIDAYIVALPDTLHEEVTVQLLRAGKPVLVEKPMAHTLTAARAMAAAAKEGSARLMVGQILRFDPRYAGAAQAVADGQIGEPLHAKAGRIASRAVGTRMNGTSSVLFYLGIHDVDAIQWVIGKPITRVYSRAVSKLMPSLGVTSEDAIVSTVEFEGGAVGQLFNGWTRTLDNPIGIDGRLEVFGTGGVVEIDVRDHGLKLYAKSGYQLPDGLHWPEVNGRIQGDLAAEVSHFARSVVDSSPFVVPLEAAMRNVAVNDAILRSVDSGRPEDVEMVAV